jgi:acyl dehydratase
VSEHLFERLTVGQSVPEQRFELDTLDFVKYCGASDDYARQHWDHLYMSANGFPGVVGHGWLTFAKMCKIVTDWIPLELADITRYAVRYHRPTLPGRLRCGGEVVGKDPGARTLELSLWARSADDQLIASAPTSLQFISAVVGKSGESVP